MWNNFRKTAVLEKNMNCKLKLHSKGFYLQILGAVTVLKFLQTVALDFAYICLQFFPGNFSFELNFRSFYNENNGQISAFRNEKGITEISEKKILSYKTAMFN